MSRIPVPVSYLKRDRTSSAPSNMQEVQQHIQQKFLPRKEKQLMMDPQAQGMPPSRPFRGQHKSADSVTRSGGSVREFFRERRNLDSANSQAPLPDINQHYRTVRPQQNGFMEPNENYRLPSGPKSKPPLPSQIRKPGSGGIGIDKSKPLAPIRKSPITRQDSYEERVNRQASREQHYSPFQKPQAVRQRQWKNSNTSDSENSNSNTPVFKRKLATIKGNPVNKTKAGRYQDTNNNFRRRISRDESEDEKSDFRTWRMEQDRNRAERLENHARTKKPPLAPIKRKEQGPSQNQRNNRNVPVSSTQALARYESSDEEDGDSGNISETSSNVDMDEVKRKEQQLMALIQKQQEELERMRTERQRDEKEVGINGTCIVL